MSSALAYYFQAFPLKSDFVKPAIVCRAGDD